MRFHLFFVFDTIGAQKRCFIEHKIVNRSFLFWDNIPIKKKAGKLSAAFLSVNLRKLFLAVIHNVLQGFAGFEFSNFASGNCYRLTSARVDSRGGRSLRSAESAETDQTNIVAGFQGVAYRANESIQCFGAIGLCQTGFVRDALN